MGNLEQLFVNPNGSGTLAFILLMAVVGIVIGCSVMLWQIKVPGALVRALSGRGAYGADRAVYAAELGYRREWVLRFLLSENGALHKYVGVIPTEKDKKGRDLLTCASLYLREETKDRAELRYRKGNATTGALIAAIVLFTALAIIMYFIIPDLIKMLENFISSLKGGLE